jgi:hypothetical protein
MMNCNRAKEILPLYAGGDLSAAEANTVSAHLQQCGGCRAVYDGLASHQKLLRSLRQPTVSPAALASMRQQLLPRLSAQRLGWWVQLERFFLVEARRPRLAFAGAAIAAVLSATFFAQLWQVTANPTVAVFEGSDTLRLPSDYRNWIALGTSSTGPHAGDIYVSPAAYHEYERHGKFPEGTMMVLESNAAGDGGIILEASVKDRRFSDGWGYFRFDTTAEGLAKKTRALPESAGCLACHRDRGI